jgi:hypothetical protein
MIALPAIIPMPEWRIAAADCRRWGIDYADSATVIARSPRCARVLRGVFVLVVTNQPCIPRRGRCAIIDLGAL